MPRVRRRTKLLALLVSSAVGIVIFLLDLFFVRYATPNLFNDLLILSYLVAVTPPMLVDHLDQRWKSSADRHLPSLLRDVAMGQLAGKTLPRALEDTSKTERGALSSELQKTLARIDAGVDFHDAIRGLGERLGTRISKQIMNVVVISDVYGGATPEVFERAADYAESMVEYRDERRGRVGPYVSTFYVSVMIFVGLTIMLLKWLLPAFLSLKGVTPGRTVLGSMTLDEYRDTFLMAAIIVSTFAGLTCGKISAGSLSAGVKHIVPLILFSYFSYLYFLGT